MPSVLGPIENSPYLGGNRPGVLSVDAAGRQKLIKHNLTAGADPTVLDDVGAGYAPGSRWTTVAGKVWECVDSSALAAVWKDLTASSLPGGSGAELQMRAGPAAFGAVTGSSFSAGMLTLPRTTIFASGADPLTISRDGESAYFSASSSLGGYFQPVAMNRGISLLNGMGTGVLQVSPSDLVGINKVSGLTATLHQVNNSNVVGHRTDLAPGQSADAVQVTTSGGLAGDLHRVDAAGTVWLQTATISGNPKRAGIKTSATSVAGDGIVQFTNNDGYGGWVVMPGNGAGMACAPYHGLRFGSSVQLQFCGGAPESTPTVGLGRNADGVLEVNSGTLVANGGSLRDLTTQTTYANSGFMFSGGGAGGLKYTSGYVQLVDFDGVPQVSCLRGMTRVAGMMAIGASNYWTSDVSLERIDANTIGINSGTAGQLRDLKLRQIYVNSLATPLSDSGNGWLVTPPIQSTGSITCGNLSAAGQVAAANGWLLMNGYQGNVSVYHNPSGGANGTLNLFGAGTGTVNFPAQSATQVPLTVTLAANQTADAIQVFRSGESLASFRYGPNALYPGYLGLTLDSEYYGAANPAFLTTDHGGRLYAPGEFVYGALRNDSVGRISSSEQGILFGSSNGMVRWTNAYPWYSGAADTGITRSSAGVVEFNNGTVGQFRDLRARNVDLQYGTLTASLWSSPTNGSALTWGWNRLHSINGQTFVLGAPYGAQGGVATIYFAPSDGAAYSDVAIQRTGSAGSGVLEIVSENLGTNYRDLRLRHATGEGYYLSTAAVNRGVVYFSAGENRLASYNSEPWVVESNAGLLLRRTSDSNYAPLTAGATTIQAVSGDCLTITGQSNPVLNLRSTDNNSARINLQNLSPTNILSVYSDGSATSYLSAYSTLVLEAGAAPQAVPIYIKTNGVTRQTIDGYGATTISASNGEQLTLQGYPGQSSSLLKLNDSSGTSLFNVTPAGAILRQELPLCFAGINGISYGDTIASVGSGPLTISPYWGLKISCGYPAGYDSPLFPALHVQTSASNTTADLFRLTNAGNTRFAVTPGGATTIVATSGNPLTVQSNGTIGLRVDESLAAGVTRLLLYDVDSATLQRVKVGSNGTGPGGVGRALYLANA